MNGEVAIGFYGKLPVLGDFVGRGVAPTIVDRWDGWLQEAMAASRASLGEQWLDLYLTAPMWRFHAHAGVLDGSAVAGVVFPSVDRVGRYFPLTVFATLPPDAVGLVVADRCTSWFERVEDLVLAQLDDDSRDVDDFAAALTETAARLVTDLGIVAERPWSRGFPDATAQELSCLHVPLGTRLDVGPAALSWLEQLIVRQTAAPVMWWSSGSNSVRPCWLVTQGLPEPGAFGSMLTGNWQEWPWSSCALPDASAMTSPMSLHLESAGSTHPGRQRKENQDAFVANPQSGIWVVADGMGGHSDGRVASSMVRDALGAIAPKANLASSVSAVKAALAEVNSYLHSMSLRHVDPVVSGTTVVAVLVDGTHGVCLWAGDSRLYRLRGEELKQLSVDHSEDEERTDANGLVRRSNVITRAIGGRDDLELEQLSFDIRVGDRLLLCSDGLYRELSAEKIRELLSTGDAIATVDGMIKQVLLGEASDNVTVVVIDAQPGT
jgi:type VI secretion system protein ImpM